MDTELGAGTAADADGDVIRGHVVLELADTRRAMSESREAKRLLFRVMTIAGCALVVLTVSAWTTNGGFNPTMLAPVLGTALLGVSLVWGLRQAAKKVVENKTEAERNITFAFDAAGYDVLTPVSKVRADWTSVHGAHESPSTFYLYTASNAFQLVPKRAFRTEDVPKLRELIRARVSERPVKNRTVRMVILWLVLIVSFLAVWQFMEGASESGAGKEPAEEAPR
jgi:YcxB-like protein